VWDGFIWLRIILMGAYKHGNETLDSVKDYEFLSIK
jgi:hypothetical protein